jgi:hypothetical protein
LDVALDGPVLALGASCGGRAAGAHAEPRGGAETPLSAYAPLTLERDGLPRVRPPGAPPCGAHSSPPCGR